jgi:hypothetical protein
MFMSLWIDLFTCICPCGLICLHVYVPVDLSFIYMYMSLWIYLFTCICPCGLICLHVYVPVDPSFVDTNYFSLQALWQPQWWRIYNVQTYITAIWGTISLTNCSWISGGCRGRDRMVIGFTFTYAISTYNH